MSTTTHRQPQPDAAASASTHAADPGVGPLAPRALALLRIGFGLTFLWAFLDKLLALGFATGRGPEGEVDRFGDAAWIHGASPTEGFLTFGTDGPLADVYQGIAGAAWADALFMLGLVAIGTALTLGVGMRVAAASGALLYVLMWSAALPPANNPVLDEHLLGGLTLVVLAAYRAGDTWGLGRRWRHALVVRRLPVLR